MRDWAVSWTLILLIWTGRRRNALKGFRGHETGVEGMAEKENVLEWVNALIT